MAVWKSEALVRNARLGIGNGNGKGSGKEKAVWKIQEKRWKAAERQNRKQEKNSWQSCWNEAAQHHFRSLQIG